MSDPLSISGDRAQPADNSSFGVGGQPQGSNVTTGMTPEAGVREALRKIAEGDVPRPEGKLWRSDGKASKNDQCVHEVWMYEDCGNCIAEFALAALSTPTTENSAEAVERVAVNAFDDARTRLKYQNRMMDSVTYAVAIDALKVALTSKHEGASKL
jgi:hypothetical protein